MKAYTICIVFLASCVLLSAQDVASRHLEVYPLGFCEPSAAEEAAKAIIGEGGTVILDKTNLRLLVAATDDEHALISELLTKLNVPPRNVRIDVQFQGTSSSRDTGAGIGAQGGVIIEDGDVHSTVRINPRLEHRVTTSSSDVTQTLLVASGREGRLEIGEQVPYLEWIIDYGFRCGVLHERVNWQRVGSYLIVQPTVIGEGPLVRVRITPELSGLVEGNPHHVRFARAATEITVSDGTTVRIGGLNRDEDFYSHFLVGFERSEGGELLDILLTPHIMTTPSF